MLMKFMRRLFNAAPEETPEQKRSGQLLALVEKLRNQIDGGLGSPKGTYPGSELNELNQDFMGDWRSADGWMRFDMTRVRARSRQLERGNTWCKSFAKSLINNVVGSEGFRCRPNVVNSAAFGDAAEATVDKIAVAKIKAFRKQVEKKENFTTRKRLDAQDVDRLQVCRLAFDGEVIFRKIKKFDNDVGFSWQMVDPDYLDHNLNRIEPNGNYTKMGVELDAKWKFPVAYWFRRRRPNDMTWNYWEPTHDLYERVVAEDIHHIFMQTDDSEQTRGWPWVFAACVNLFRLGKYEEAALINAVIGASKMGFFKKTIPDGFTEDWDQLQEDDPGAIIDEVSPGTWTELPWNVEPVQWDGKYPDEQMEVFEKVMLRGISASLGSSYMSMTGDVSDANFSNLRAAKSDENEEWMTIQGFWIRNWKQPEYDESIYRGILSRKLELPLSKIDKFVNPVFTGRRWSYVNPVDDLKAKQLELAIGITSVTEIIEGRGGDATEVFAQIGNDKEIFDKMEVNHPFGRDSAALTKEDAQTSGEEAEKEKGKGKDTRQNKRGK